MLKNIFKYIFGEGGGLRKADLDIARYKFSSYLPYVAFTNPNEDSIKDNDLTVGYYLKNNNFAYIFKCHPLIVAGEKSFSTIASMLKEPLPEESIIQFSLYADNYLDDIVDYYVHARNDANIIFKEQYKTFGDFVKKGTGGSSNLSGTPFRNFTLYVSISIPIQNDLIKNPDKYRSEVEKYISTISNIFETLKSMGLTPRIVKPSELITDLYRILNPTLEKQKRLIWNPGIPIWKQIIFADTEIDVEKDALRFNDTYVMCLTPKTIPPKIDIDTFNNMYGFFGVGNDSMSDDLKQIQSPFIFTTTYYLKNIRGILEAKAQQVLAQQAAGSLAPSIQRRQEEFLWMLDTLEKGEKFLKVIPQLVIFGKNKDAMYEKVNRVRTMWTELGVESQMERNYLIKPLVVASLPAGMYKEIITQLDRDFIINSNNACFLAPIQGGFAGFGKVPAMTFFDRRGQIALCDFSQGGPNKNFYITGGSGNGKSFLGNTIVNAYLSIGSKVRIIDVGFSYKKACQVFDGQFITIQDGIIINFFEKALEFFFEDEDVTLYNKDFNPVTKKEGNSRVDIDINNFILDNNYVMYYNVLGTEYYVSMSDILVKKEFDPSTLIMLVNIIATMCISRTSDTLEEIDLVLIEKAIVESLLKYETATTIDDIYQYLLNIQDHIDNVPDLYSYKKEEMVKRAFHLANSLYKFTSEGIYGKYFNGKSTVSFDNPLVVVELDGVVEDLRKVIVLAFAAMIEQEVYSGDRKTFTLVILDEAWQTLSDNPYAGKFVEGLYRKARKYNCGVGIITQSLADLDLEQGKLKYLGQVIKSQSSFAFHLQDKEFEYARKRGILDVDDYVYNVFIRKMPLRSLPKYSEIFANTPDGSSVIRLIADPFTYFINTSDPNDNTFLEYHAKDALERGLATTKEEAFVYAVKYAVNLVNELGGMSEFKHYLSNKFARNIK